ncbi:MAG: permease-like cell division protein FtsX [Candidatus Saccharibacteria bacterium]|nr:permease-like cell division protein FtsX [Candidatus Saccharibacteria bacterium]
MTKKSTSANNKTSAELRRKKQLRRRYITFIRMCRYGVNNFSRNAWLTIAATIVMTITLLVIFSTLVARSVLLDTVNDLRQKVDISIYLEKDTKQSTVDKLTTKLEKLDQVSAVTYITPDEAKDKLINSDNPSQQTLDFIGEYKDGFLPGALRVVPTDLNNMDEIEKLVSNDKLFQESIDTEHKPSYAGPKREAIENIGRGVYFAERAGLAASAIFIGISILIIFNTIRMAIFNRKEEIEMMKLIGAEKSFIQGPFIVESMMYGFFAAIFAFIFGLLGLVSLQSKLHDYGILVDNTYDFVITASPFIIIGLIFIGALIGLASSFFAVNRHLKIN